MGDNREIVGKGQEGLELVEVVIVVVVIAVAAPAPAALAPAAPTGEVVVVVVVVAIIINVILVITASRSGGGGGFFCCQCCWCCYCCCNSSSGKAIVEPTTAALVVLVQQLKDPWIYTKQHPTQNEVCCELIVKNSIPVKHILASKWKWNGKIQFFSPKDIILALFSPNMAQHPCIGKMMPSHLYQRSEKDAKV